MGPCIYALKHDAKNTDIVNYSTELNLVEGTVQKNQTRLKTFNRSEFESN